MVHTRGGANGQHSNHARLSALLRFLQSNSALIVAHVSQLTHSLGSLRSVIRRLGTGNIALGTARRPISASATTNGTFFSVLNIFTRFRAGLHHRQRVRKVTTTGIHNICGKEGPRVGPSRIHQLRRRRGLDPATVTGQLGVTHSSICHFLPPNSRANPWVENEAPIVRSL